MPCISLSFPLQMGKMKNWLWFNACGGSSARLYIFVFLCFVERPQNERCNTAVFGKAEKKSLLRRKRELDKINCWLIKMMRNCGHIFAPFFHHYFSLLNYNLWFEVNHAKGCLWMSIFFIYFRNCLWYLFII